MEELHARDPQHAAPRNPAHSADPGWRLQHRNWTPSGDDGWLGPGPRGAVPGPWLVLDPPLAERFHIDLHLTAAGIDVLRIRCRSKGPAGLCRRDVCVAVAPSGALHHALDRAALAIAETAAGIQIRLALSGTLEPGETLREIALDPVTAFFAEATPAPGMRLRIDDIRVLPADPALPRVPFAASRREDDPLHQNHMTEGGKTVSSREPSPQPPPSGYPALCAGEGARAGYETAGIDRAILQNAVTSQDEASPTGAPLPVRGERGSGWGEGSRHESATTIVPARGSQTGTRDAVLFAWWVPGQPEARKVGEYYLGLLRYHHPDSRIFLGVNHGSDPALVAAAASSGLDIEICPVPLEIDVTSDTAGFLAALAAFHRCDETFDLVWFGHTKGASQPHYADYRLLRFDLERRFWSRRAAAADAFRDPRIGVWAMNFIPPPTYPFPPPWHGWTGELAALQRVYRDRFPPLGLNALDTFFVLRAGIVRTFCDTVGEAFFRIDPHEYGASRWFFEMAFPSIATMQGYEPFIATDVPGTGSPRDDILLDGDVKQHHRLCREELRRWREHPAGFSPHVLPWDRPAWQRL